MVKKKKVNMDLNRDGVVNGEDRSIAGKVLASKKGKKKKVKEPATEALPDRELGEELRKKNPNLRIT